MICFARSATNRTHRMAVQRKIWKMKVKICKKLDIKFQKFDFCEFSWEIVKEFVFSLCSRDHRVELFSLLPVFVARTSNKRSSSWNYSNKLRNSSSRVNRFQITRYWTTSWKNRSITNRNKGFVRQQLYCYCIRLYSAFCCHNTL